MRMHHCGLPCADLALKGALFTLFPQLDSFPVPNRRFPSFGNFYVYGHIPHAPKPLSFFLPAKSSNNYPIEYIFFESIFTCCHFSSPHLQNDSEKKRTD